MMLEGKSSSDGTLRLSPRPSRQSSSNNTIQSDNSQSSEMAEMVVAQAEAALRQEHILSRNGGRVPFVGRDRELAYLEDAFNRLATTSSFSRTCSSPSEASPTTEQSAQSRPAARVICIEGPAGMGKTTLVRQMRTKVMGEGDDQNNSSVGFFLTGKFTQQNPNCEAYTGLASAVQELVNQILDRDFDMSIRRRLEEAVTLEDADALVDIFPSLYRVFAVKQQRQNNNNNNQSNITTSGSNNNSGGGGGGEEHNSLQSQRSRRRHFLFRQFFRAIASKVSYEDDDVDVTAEGGVDDETASSVARDGEEKLSIVLVLDDVQWIDAPSLELISALVEDSDLDSFMLVATHRVISDRDHSFLQKVEQWKSQEVNVELLRVENLDKMHVNAIVSTFLDEEPAMTESLANVLHKKTLGNPFFTVESLKALVDQNIVVYSYGQTCWKWDMERIESMLIASDDASSLLTMKLERLDMESRIILVAASCLRDSFSAPIMEEIIMQLLQDDDLEEFAKYRVRDTRSAVEGTLERFVGLGILGRRGDDGYSFMHDLIRQAATDILPPKTRMCLRLRVGQCLLRISTQMGVDNATSSLLFLGVDLCNGSSELLDSAEKFALAKNMLSASARAMRESAFALSLKYAEAGLTLAGQDRPEINAHKEEFDCLHGSLLLATSEAAYCVGDFENVRQRTEAINHHSCSEHVRRRSMLLGIQSALAEENSDLAVDLGFELLGSLGIKRIRKAPSLFSVAFELLKTKYALRGQTQESLQQLPISTDENRLMAFQCLENLQVACYLTNTNLFFTTLMLSMQWSIQFGISVFSPSVFAIYGALQMSVFNNPEAGIMFGEVALALSERLGIKDSKKATAVVFFMIRPNKHNMRLSYAPLLYCHKLSMESGDTETALLSVMYSIFTAWCTSQLSLSALSKELKKYTLLSLGFKYHEFSSAFGRLSNGLRRLGNAEDFDWLDDVENHIRYADRSDTTQAFLDVLFLQEHYLLGEFEEALPLAKATQSVGKKVLPCFICVPRVHFLRALIFLSQKGDVNFREVNSITRMLQKWIDEGNPNCEHMLRLIEAELSRVKQSSRTFWKSATRSARHAEDILRLYGEAVRLARHTGHVHDAGVSHECIARYHLNNDNRSAAEQHIQRASACFQKWGAGGKVSQLKRDYKNLFVSLAESGVTEFRTSTSQLVVATHSSKSDA